MISILMPIYNTPIEYIKECIDSINNQTFNDYEVVIVNDGSNEVTTDFLNQIDNPKYIIHHIENGGISKALNYGLTKCKYDLVARMDGDDIMLPNRLEVQYNYMMNNDVDILGSQMELFGSQSSITNHPLVVNVNSFVKSDWFMNHPTIMFKRELIIKVGGYNSNFDGLEDLELWCKSLCYNMKIENLPDVLLKHRRHDQNATVKNNLGEILKKVSHVRNFYYQKLIKTN